MSIVETTPVSAPASLRGKQIEWEEVKAGKLYYITPFCQNAVLARLDKIWFSPHFYDDQRIWYTEVSGARHFEDLSGPSPFFEYLGPDVKVATWKEYVASHKKK
jgi:hypothetical protein